MQPNDMLRRGRSTAEEIRERVSRSVSDGGTEGIFRRIKGWILLRGDRRAVALVLVGTVYLLMLGMGFVWPFELQRVLTEEATVERLLNTLLSGVILLVSIVVSINSLVLSEELAPIGRQHERTVDSWEFRTQATEVTQTAVSPASPAEFLGLLLRTVDEKTAMLDRRGEKPLHDDRHVQEFVVEMRAYVEKTWPVLVDDGELGSIDMRLFGPQFDPLDELEAARQIVEKSETLPDEVARPMETLTDALQYFTTAREYFKTMFYKREYARLSRDLLYTGIPTVMIISYAILAINADMLGGTTLWLDNLYLFVTLTYVLALTPLLVLASYIARGAVIAENTVTAGGFLLE